MTRAASNWRGYPASLLVLALATGAGYFLRPYFGPVNIALIYLLAVVFSATTWGLGPSILCAVLGVLTLDALFVLPYGLFSVSAPEELLTFGVFLIVGAVISHLGSRLRDQVQVATQRERETAALYALNREIAFAPDQRAVLDAARNQLRAVFHTEPELLLTPEIQGKAAAGHLTAAGERDTSPPGSPVGASVSPAHDLVLPLRTAQSNLGLLALSGPTDRSWTRADARLFEAFATQIALALEHLALAEAAERTRLTRVEDDFRNALYSSLSHDLRTPLVSIIGAVTYLLDASVPSAPATRTELLTTILEEATRLNRLVTNLLQMTRVQAGALKPLCDWHSVEELVETSLAHTDTRDCGVELDIDPELPLVRFDFLLMEQVLNNLVENAVKFSPAGSSIIIRAACRGDDLVVSVLDRGMGIPTADLEQVFERFYRVSRDPDTPGTGLGLVICRGIVAAHGGTIRAERRPGGGTIIRLTIPSRSESEMERSLAV